MLKDFLASRQSRILMAAVLLIGVIGLAVFIFLRMDSRQAGFYVAVGPVPASPLFTLNKDKTELVRVTLPVNGKDLPVLDVKEAPNDITYYILAEPADVPEGNVYRKDADGSITRITESKTAKYNLTYSADSGLLAYESTVIKDDADYLTLRPWDIEVLDPATGKAKVVAQGSAPHFAQGGQSVFFMAKDGLSLIPVGAAQDTKPISLQIQGSLLAINDDATEMVLYNAVTQSLDRYKILNTATFSYVSSTKIGSQPSTLGFSSGDLLIGTVAVNQASTTYYFRNPSISPFKIKVPGLAGLTPQRIY